MQVTALEGMVENGKIRLREDIAMAECTRVFVIVADLHAGPSGQIRTPELAHPQRAGDVRKQVLEEIPTNAMGAET